MKTLFIDARAIFRDMDGLGFYSTFLIRRLLQVFATKLRIIVCVSPTANDLSILNPDSKHNVDVVYAESERFGSYTYDLDAWDAYVATFKPDIYLSTAFFQTSYRCPKAVVIHDLIPLISSRLSETKKTFYSYVLSHAVKNSDLIIVNSSHTRSELLSYVDGPAPEVQVVYPDIHSIMERVRSESSEMETNDYFLMVGVKCPRKNVDLVIASLKLLKKSRIRDCRVLFVGKLREKDVPLKDIIAKEGLEDLAQVQGYVSDARLGQLIAGSRGLVFPSTHEGFGIPIIEFLSSGKPVICLRTTSIPEVAADLPNYIHGSPASLVAEMLAISNSTPTSAWHLRVRRHLQHLVHKNNLQFKEFFSWIHMRS